MKERTLRTIYPGMKLYLFKAIYPGVQPPLDTTYSLVGLACWKYKHATGTLKILPGKTILQHLQDLPEPYRSQALKNMWWEDKDNRYPTLEKALSNAFKWSKSPQKYKYWHNIHAQLVGNDPLP